MIKQAHINELGAHEYQFHITVYCDDVKQKKTYVVGAIASSLENAVKIALQEDAFNSLIKAIDES